MRSTLARMGYQFNIDDLEDWKIQAFIKIEQAIGPEARLMGFIRKALGGTRRKN